MQTEPQIQPAALQPFTPRGVARFAHARFSRLLLAEFLAALVVAAAVIWFCGSRFSPVITQSLQQLPDTAKVEAGKLSDVESGLLANSKFLSLTIDLEAETEEGTADVQLKFHQQDFEVCSLLGCIAVIYPSDTIPLGRPISDPWWGAWKPVVIAMIGLATILSLMISWPLFALIYMFPTKLLAYFADRDLSWRAAWQMCCAAQLTAALYVAVAIVLYGLQVFDLVRLLFFYSAHFVIALVYVFSAPFFLPRMASGESVKGNPFGTK